MALSMVVTVTGLMPGGEMMVGVNCTVPTSHAGPSVSASAPSLGTKVTSTMRPSNAGMFVDSCWATRLPRP